MIGTKLSDRYEILHELGRRTGCSHRVLRFVRSDPRILFEIDCKPATPGFFRISPENSSNSFRPLHKKHAEALEQRFAGRLERVYPELVHHYAQADVPARVVDYGLRLARKALEALSHEEAAKWMP